jgi:hypothetical protein
MLERETELIIETLRTKTIGENDSVTLRLVLSSDIPRSVKAYMHAETVRWLAEDLHTSAHFGRIDRTVPGNERLTRSFLLSLAEGYTFERGSYLALLENAVHFLENYLCRPQWTIENFVLESGERSTLQSILTKLEHTVDYSYFKTIAERIARRRGWTDIGRADLRAMLAMIDDRVVKEHNARELALLAKPMFDFILMRDTPPDVAIPLKPVLVFFEDKKMKILRDYIESICRIRQRDDITLDELTALVEDLYLGHTDPPLSLETPSPSGNAGDLATEDASLHPADQGGETAGDFATPSAAGLQSDAPVDHGHGETGEATETDPDAEQFDRAAPAETPAARNLALSLTFAGLTEGPSSQASPLPRLRDMIVDHARSRFVRRLFQRDEHRFNEVVDRLEGLPTWKEASGYLLELYQTIDLDPYDADMVAFTDTIHRRYAGTRSDTE